MQLAALLAQKSLVCIGMTIHIYKCQSTINADNISFLILKSKCNSFEKQYKHVQWVVMSISLSQCVESLARINSALANTANKRERVKILHKKSEEKCIWQLQGPKSYSATFVFTFSVYPVEDLLKYIDPQFTDHIAVPDAMKLEFILAGQCSVDYFVESWICFIVLVAVHDNSSWQICFRSNFFCFRL